MAKKMSLSKVDFIEVMYDVLHNIADVDKDELLLMLSEDNVDAEYAVEFCRVISDKYGFESSEGLEDVCKKACSMKFVRNRVNDAVDSVSSRAVLSDLAEECEKDGMFEVASIYRRMQTILEKKSGEK